MRISKPTPLTSRVSSPRNQQCFKGSSFPHDSIGRTYIAQKYDNGRHRFQHVAPGQGVQHGKRDKYDEVKEKVTAHADDRLRRYRPSAHRDYTDHPGMQGTFDFLPADFQQHDHAGYLYPAGRGCGTTTYDGRVKQQKTAESRPVAEILRGQSGCAHDGYYLEKRIAERLE